ncbi:MAG TPA: hypothetical protein VFI31_30275 [Pirellulales bacterium]|nr:hypothetical protein [Pirellulales bacterium]
MPIHDWTRVRAGVFHDFHQEWTICIKRALNGGILPEGYYAMVEAPPRVGITETIHSDPYAERSNRVVAFNGVDENVGVIEIVSPGNKGSRNDFQWLVGQLLRFLHEGIHVLIVDLFPPTARDPQGVHAALWSQLDDCDFQLPPGKLLTTVSYSAGHVKCAYLEPLAVGDSLPAMPLFLEAESYVEVPIEATYQTAFDDVPKPYRDELTA